MPIVDRYILRQIFVATFFVTLILAALIFLTQSLRFLDLVVNAGASGLDIWVQTLLVLPGFFEIVLPIGMVAAVLFIYNRLMIDNELAVMKALGFSSLQLARPALTLSFLLGVALFFVMGWLAPNTKSEAYTLRQKIQDQMTTMIFQQGIFNEVGDGLMVYIRDRDSDGNLQGLIIHDTRDETKSPTTIIAAKGILVTNGTTQQVVVYNGSRQEADPTTGILRRLDFDRYTVDLPQPEKDTTERIREPDERTLGELLARPDRMTREDRSLRRQLRTEIQKRFLTPFLVPAFSCVGIAILMLGGFDRRGQSKRILAAITVITLLQILYLVSYHIAKQSSLGFPLMIVVAIGSMAGSFLCLKQEGFGKHIALLIKGVA